MDGVDSVHDPNGCQRSTVSALGDYTEPRLGEERGRPLGTAWVVKMKILEYLQKKYLVEAPTTMLKTEARILGIEFPLQPGWREAHGEREIDLVMKSRLLKCASSRNDRFSARAIEALGKEIATPEQADAVFANPESIDGFVITKNWLVQFCTQKGAYSQEQIDALSLTCDMSKGWKTRIVGTVISQEQRKTFEAEAKNNQDRLKFELSRQISIAQKQGTGSARSLRVKAKAAKKARKISRSLGFESGAVNPHRNALVRQPTEQSVKNYIVQHSGVDPASDAFLSTFEWKALRMMALKKYSPVCQCCGASTKTGAVMHVDHIKPRKIFPQLALDVENLQVLCGDCNAGKGNWDMTDWRKTGEHAATGHA